MDQPISTTDNPAPAAADNPQGPAATDTGTGGTSGQPTGAGPAVDLFRGIDPSKLPPEVKSHYDSMLRDYREKTTKLSETTKAEVAKAVADYKQKAELYDQVSGHDEFVKMWNEYVQKQNGQPSDPNDPQAELRKEMQAIKEQIAAAETKQFMDAFADATDEKGNRVNAAFDELNSMVIGKQGEKERSLLWAGIQLAQGKTLQERITNGYANVKKLYDTIFEAGKKAQMGRTQAKILNGSNPPSGANGEVLTVTEKKPKSAREALEMAKKGVVVSRD